MAPTRRQLLGWGLGLGAAAGAGLAGRALLLPPAPSRELAGVDELAARLFDALRPEDRAEACVGYAHPLRQYHNRGVDTGGRWGIRLTGEARQLLVDLVHAGLSELGRRRIPEQWFFQLPGVNVCRLLICGNPHQPPYQVLVTGPHLNLRLGGRNREGVAFGGPQVYGDQRGNGEPGLPGNVYRQQLEAGQRLVAGLTPATRSAVRQPRAPVQTGIELQGAAGRFHGVPVGDLDRASRDRAEVAVTRILETYRDEDVAYAWECLRANGGIEALHLADYDQDHQHGRNVAGGPSQIFRLEGPAAVFHYRGEPHLHAFLNVGMDGERPLSVGETLGINPTRLEAAQVKALFERVLAATLEADLAYYPEDSVAGFLRAGEIRTGDLYNLESWRDVATRVEVRGDALAPPMAAALGARGQAVDATRRYRIATVGWVADALAEETLGEIAEREEGQMLRDLAIAHLRQHGFGAA